MQEISQEPFRNVFVIGFSNSNGAQTVYEMDLPLSNLGARAVAIGSTYEFFRFAKLSAYCYTDAVAPDGVNGILSGSQYLSFVESNAALTGTATTINQLSQYQYFKAGNVFDKLKLSISKAVLRQNMYKWFNTASTGAATDSLSPGIFIAANQTNLSAATTAVTQWIVVEGIIEFMGRITPALSFRDAQEMTKSSPSSSSKAVQAIKYEPDEPTYTLVKIVPQK